MNLRSLIILLSLLCNLLKANTPERHASIGNMDSVIFDVSHAIVNGGYVVIPVLCQSSDTINALDFELKFDVNKLTYDSLIVYKSYLSTLAHYNPNDSTLRLTSNSFQSYDKNTALVGLRFRVTNPCMIQSGDFTPHTTFLNGSPCSNLATPAHFVPQARFWHNALCTGFNSFRDTSLATGGAASWSWNFGNGAHATSADPVVLYATAGIYTVTLQVTGASGCSDSLKKQIRINNTPVVNFTSFFNCTKDSVKFTDSTTVLAGNLRSWHWNFGDGSTAVLQDPSHRYAVLGTYTVVMTALTDSGCSASCTKSLFVNKPAARFLGPATGCEGSSISFRDSSYTLTGVVSTWNWNFGDGTTSILQNPVHIFGVAGTFTVSLKITTSLNCTDSIVHVVTVGTKPLVNFISANLTGCAPLSVSFSDSSLAPPGSVYTWSFGDNGTSAGINPVHAYLNGGIYTVKHIVVSAAGCSDSLIRTGYIHVYAPPQVSFATGNVCLGSPTPFTDSSAASGASVTGWHWSFGDGSTGGSQNPVHLYGNSGTFQVTLKATTSQGCADSLTKPVTVNAQPVVRFKGINLSGCAPLVVHFIDSTTTVPGSVYLWNFGDFTTSTQVNPTHSFAGSGSYSIKLTVISPGGCADSLVRNAYVSAGSSATAKFSAFNTCQGNSTSFRDSSTTSAGSLTGWKWSFGDGNTSPSQNPFYIYGAPGTYTVSLKINTSLGCSDSVSRLIIIYPQPSVVFSATPLTGCVPLQVSFKDSTTNGGGGNYSWTFGDTQISAVKNPSHLYLDTGTYTVTHLVVTGMGCRDSLTRSGYIRVSEPPVVSFSSSSHMLTIPNASFHFTDLSSGYNSWQWTFGDSTSSVQKNASHTYSNAGVFDVCLVVHNTAGCQARSCDSVTVLNPNCVAVPGAFTPNGDGNNDLLLVRGGPLVEMEFRVFNEWGNQIFYTNSQHEGWDGNYMGTSQPLGVYEYTLTGTTTEHKRIKMNGVVSLIR